MLEGVLEGVDEGGQERGAAPGHQPHQDAAPQADGANQQRVLGNGENGAGAEQVAAQQRGGRAGEGDGDDAARLPLKEEQLDDRIAATGAAKVAAMPRQPLRQRRAASCARRW